MSVETTKQINETPLVTGNLWHAIWTMSWPLLLTTIANSLVSLTDVKVASLLGSHNQAAVGLAENIIFMFMVFILSLGVGTTAIVARAFGARDQKEMILAAGQSFAFSVIMGLILSCTAGLCAQYMIGLFTRSQQVFEAARTYLNAYSLVLIPYSVSIIANALFRAIGDSKKPLIVVSTMTAINITLDVLLVVYQWPVKGLGIVGMAWAGLIAALIGATLSLFLVRRSILAPCLGKIWPVHKDILRRLSAIGLPSAFQRLGWTLSVFVVFFILDKCQDSVAALASWTIGMRVESLIYMPLMALSLAVSSIIGQNLGANETDRAIQAGWRVTNIGIIMMVILGFGLFAFAGPVARSMSTDIGTIAYTTSYLRINCLAEPFLALAMVLTGALQGAGDTKSPMWFTIITNWLVRLPLAYFLAIALHLGPEGVWWAMTTSILLQAVLVTWRFHSKAWLTVKV